MSKPNIFLSHLAKEYMYIYKEYKATSLRLHSADIYPRKQEAVRKTTPELLSAELRSLLCRVRGYTTSS